MTRDSGDSASRGRGDPDPTLRAPKAAETNPNSAPKARNLKKAFT